MDPVIDVRPVKGQIEDLHAEIMNRVKKKERVLVTTLTKKMAEDITDYFKDLNMKVAYLHSEIDTIQRVEIIRDLRKGIYDCLVGINLLREGLDIPEVSLVAVLDADKEGFLRNYKSLIQTIGRAARNVNGMAILYADKVTDSMTRAIEETGRRRKIQIEYNEKFGITPTTIKKEISNILERENRETDELARMSEEIERKFNYKKFSSREELKLKLKEAMMEEAASLNFEKAAMLRDKMMKIKLDSDND